MMKRLLIFLALAAVAGCSSEGGSGSCTATTPASCPATTPSYATDVAPIMTKYCTSCHVAGGQEGDKPLDTHAGVAALSGDVSHEISGCSMPPSDELQPTDAEREAVLAWIVCGAPNN